ncbi:uncharacterized protein LOC109931828 [Rhincodon typus]|uniref:uncharacterized protein LOC109931828 n=1 Tax=Rhincodon typus TaxID=259920 RepID=UPI00202FD297|nr:uncharacterized protein LOC109931828 [Rhincodon typus]
MRPGPQSGRIADKHKQPSLILLLFSVLKFSQCFEHLRCVSVMLDNINGTTVCHFHEAASKYNQKKLVLACERWLELNLIVHLRYEITFRNLQKDVLQKTLLSPRLFTFSEYHVLQTILCWIFLQVNTEIRLVPPYSAIITYFIRLSVPASHVDIAMAGGNATLIQIQRLSRRGQQLNCQIVQEPQQPVAYPPEAHIAAKHPPRRYNRDPTVPSIILFNYLKIWCHHHQTVSSAVVRFMHRRAG